MIYIIIFLFIFIFLLFLPVKFHIEFKFEESTIYFKISSSYLFGIFSPEIYPLDRKKNNKSSSKNPEVLKNIIKELKTIELLKYIWDRLDIEKLEIKKFIGSRNPYIISILYGLMWSFDGIIFNYILSLKDIEYMDIDIISNFEREELGIDFNCIIKIKMVYIINIWFKLIKSHKGGEKNVGTSNRRINEIYNE
ncbi:MAG: DUF2953 domain-containing protein [Tissierellia bacterium]|nr:DUF2953 domain-containing protein [Tissierellia bacterium]